MGKTDKADKMVKAALRAELEAELATVPPAVVAGDWGTVTRWKECVISARRAMNRSRSSLELLHGELAQLKRFRQ